MMESQAQSQAPQPQPDEGITDDPNTAAATSTATNDRIPPPPLLEPELGWDDNDNDNNGGGSQYNLPILTVTSGPPPKNVQVKIELTQMSADLLGRSIVQAMSSAMSIASTSTSTSASMSMLFDAGPLEGLFGEDDGVFHSLEQILSTLPIPPTQSYSLVPPIRKSRQQQRQEESTKTQSWFSFETMKRLILLLLAVAVVLGMWYYFNVLIEKARLLQRTIQEWILDLPLKELYRHGPPWLGGWEGLDMAEICARITHHRNLEFWLSNVEECQRIYSAKEYAFLHWTRPIAYIVMGIVLFWSIRHLIIQYGESKRNRTDRAVLETYHAFSTLVRIANRQTTTATAAAAASSSSRKNR